MNGLGKKMSSVASAIQAQDAKRADNLRKTAGLAKRKPGTGPRVAR